jgi:hypothetical protein
MRDRRRVQAMLQQQQQQLLQLQQQPAYSSLSAGLLPSYGSSGTLRGNGSAGSGGKKGSLRLPSPAGVAGSSSSSSGNGGALSGLPMELPALPAAAEEAETLAGGSGSAGAGGAAAFAKHRRTDSLLAAAVKRVSVSAHAAALRQLATVGDRYSTEYLCTSGAQCYCDSIRSYKNSTRDLICTGATGSIVSLYHCIIVSFESNMHASLAFGCRVTDLSKVHSGVKWLYFAVLWCTICRVLPRSPAHQRVQQHLGSSAGQATAAAAVALAHLPVLPVAGQPVATAAVAAGSMQAKQQQQQEQQQQRAHCSSGSEGSRCRPRCRQRVEQAHQRLLMPLRPDVLLGQRVCSSYHWCWKVAAALYLQLLRSGPLVFCVSYCVPYGPEAAAHARDMALGFCWA